VHLWDGRVDGAVGADAVDAPTHDGVVTA